MTDKAVSPMLRVVRASWRVVGGSAAVEIASAGTGLVLAVVLVRWLGADEYGSYAFANGLVGTTVVLALPGLTNAVTVAEARGEYGFLSIALKRRLRWVVPMGALLVGLYWTPLVDQVDPTFASWGVLTIAALLNGVTSLALGALTAHQAFAALVRLQVVAFAGTVVVLVASPELRDGTWAAAIQLLIAAATQALELVLVWKRRPRVASTADHTTLNKYASEVSVVGVLGALDNRIDVLVIGSLVDATSLGAYSLARKLSELVKRLWMVANRVILPRWSRSTDAARRRQAERLIRLSLMATPICIAGAVILVGPLGSRLFDTSGTDFTLLTTLLVAGVVISLPVSVLDAYFTALTHARPITAMRVAPLLIFIIGAAPAAVVGGAAAVAGLRLIRAALGTSVGLWWFWRRDGTSLNDSGASRGKDQLEFSAQANS